MLFLGADTPGHKVHVFTATLDITSRQAPSGGRLLAACCCAALIVGLELNGPRGIINRRSIGMSQSLNTVGSGQFDCQWNAAPVTE